MGWTTAEKGLLWGGREPKRGYYGMDENRKGVTIGQTTAEKGLLWDGRQPKRGYYGMDDSRKVVIMGWTTAEKGLLWGGREPKRGYYGMDENTPSPHPYALHSQPISFFSISSPTQYWVSSTNHLAPRYAISPISLSILANTQMAQYCSERTNSWPFT